MHSVRIQDLINKDKLHQLLNQSEKSFRVFASFPCDQSHVDRGYGVTLLLEEPLVCYKSFHRLHISPAS